MVYHQPQNLPILSRDEKSSDFSFCTQMDKHTDRQTYRQESKTDNKGLLAESREDQQLAISWWWCQLSNQSSTVWVQTILLSVTATSNVFTFHTHAPATSHWTSQWPHVTDSDYGMTAYWHKMNNPPGLHSTSAACPPIPSEVHSETALNTCKEQKDHTKCYNTQQLRCQ